MEIKSKPSHTSPFQTFSQRIFSVQGPIEPSHFHIQCVLYFILVVWGLSFFGKTDFAADPFGLANSFSLLHNANLIFHEAGHFIFIPFGKFLCLLGGSFLQCLIPLLCMGHFLRQRDNFSASASLWWFGQNLLDISPYIYDSWDQKLPLIGGRNPGAHDWNNLLTMTNSLNNYAEIASFAANSGKFVLLCSFFWGGIILHKKLLILNQNM